MTFQVRSELSEQWIYCELDIKKMGKEIIRLRKKQAEIAEAISLKKEIIMLKQKHALPLHKVKQIITTDVVEEESIGEIYES